MLEGARGAGRNSRNFAKVFLLVESNKSISTNNDGPFVRF